MADRVRHGLCDRLRLRNSVHAKALHRLRSGDWLFQQRLRRPALMGTGEPYCLIDNFSPRESKPKQLTVNVPNCFVVVRAEGTREFFIQAGDFRRIRRGVH